MCTLSPQCNIHLEITLRFTYVCGIEFELPLTLMADNFGPMTYRNNLATIVIYQKT